MTDADPEIEFVTPGPTSSDRSEEKVEIVTPRRSSTGTLLSIVGIVIVGWFVVTGGDNEPQPPPATDDAPVPSTTIPPEEIQRSLDGDLADGDRFRVTEVGDGVVCATIVSNLDAVRPDRSLPFCDVADALDGTPGVIAGRLVFGQLPAEADGVALRYRERPVGNTGLRIDREAGLFALPIRGDDAYRLQFLRDGDVLDERPLVPYPSGPSQSAEAAERDGVPAELAALDIQDRIQPAAEWSALQEGPLVWSRTEADGEPWGELVRLDPTGTQILWSLPLPDIDLRAQLIRPDAMWLLGRQITFGDDIAVDRSEVRFPIVVIRLDRATDEATVVLYEQPPGVNEPVEAPRATVEAWQIGPALPAIRLDSLVLTAGGLGLDLVDPDDSERRVFLDPTTLQQVS